jgi:hypothetical protein
MRMDEVQTESDRRMSCRLPEQAEHLRTFVKIAHNSSILRDILRGLGLSEFLRDNRYPR